jgi:hypothetical protein
MMLIWIFYKNREQVRINNNPEIQWHLKKIKRDEDEFVHETRLRYKEQQRKRRIKRHHIMIKYREKKLNEMESS